MATDKRGRKLPKGIRQRSDSYEGRFNYNYKEYVVHGATIGETQKAMTELRYKLEHGLFVQKQKITLDDWFNTWINEYKKNRVKIGMIVSYTNFYNGMVKPMFGEKLISDIRGDHIQKMYNSWTDQGYALSSIKICSAIINGCLQQAVRNGLIERNPVKLAELPRQKERRTHIAMTKEQQALFMKYSQESYLYNLFAVMLRTGLRSGEARGLKYSDIDKKKRVSHICRTLKYIEGTGYIEDTPKTRTSLRNIPLTDDILELLEAQKRFWGFKIEPIDKYLFCNEIGEPLSRARVQSEIDRIIKRITTDGYDFPRLTSHCFRHTFATRAIEAGMQPQVLKTILGHSSLSMTMDLYSHVLPETRAEEMEKIASVF